ncbi:uncharacterized protein LOC118405708 isoform X2 [Branchiostoma floridae]|uniref:Uncharacterized protein LOC118405708 isoform X2 n=1 Tax=Branchiostoma floridae TaxID=7739 RepID=A0A9J7HKU0_BRAFL|nr:uncharacterized protein LOC118405708 isoform X2 [Branchiostoma floridae]
MERVILDVQGRCPDHFHSGRLMQGWRCPQPNQPSNFTRCCLKAPDTLRCCENAGGPLGPGGKGLREEEYPMVMLSTIVAIFMGIGIFIVIMKKFYRDRLKLTRRLSAPRLPRRYDDDSDTDVSPPGSDVETGYGNAYASHARPPPPYAASTGNDRRAEGDDDDSITERSSLCDPYADSDEPPPPYEEALQAPNPDNRPTTAG